MSLLRQPLADLPIETSMADGDNGVAVVKGRPVRVPRRMMRGPPGADGKDGKDGADGGPGPPGPPGAPGSPGTPGKDALPAKDGEPGKDGLPGKDGAPGAPGKDAEAPRRMVVAVPTGSTTGRITVVWPTPFPTGTVPVVEAVAVKPTAATGAYNAAVLGDPTATGCVIEVTVVPSNLVAGLVGALLPIVTAGPPGTKVHVTARA